MHEMEWNENATKNRIIFEINGTLWNSQKLKTKIKMKNQMKNNGD